MNSHARHRIRCRRRKSLPPSRPNDRMYRACPVQFGDYVIIYTQFSAVHPSEPSRPKTTELQLDGRTYRAQGRFHFRSRSRIVVTIHRKVTYPKNSSEASSVCIPICRCRSRNGMREDLSFGASVCKLSYRFV